MGFETQDGWKNLRLAEHQKPNGIEKGELNCNNLGAYTELLVQPKKCICGCAAGELTVLPQTP